VLEAWRHELATLEDAELARIQLERLMAERTQSPKA
jgi:hypothetical protein